MTNDPRQDWEDGELPDYQAGGWGFTIFAWGVVGILFAGIGICVLLFSGCQHTTSYLHLP